MRRKNRRALLALVATAPLLAGCGGDVAAEILVRGVVVPTLAAAGLAAGSGAIIDAASGNDPRGPDCARADRLIADWRVERRRNPQADFRYYERDLSCPSVQQAFRDRGMTPPGGATLVSTPRR